MEQWQRTTRLSIQPKIKRMRYEMMLVLDAKSRITITTNADDEDDDDGERIDDNVA